MTKLNSISPILKTLQPISATEKHKIESFYSSFGTTIYTSGTCACLYTMTNLKVPSITSNHDLSHRMIKPSNANRASMAIGPTNIPVKNSETLFDIDHEILTDFMNNKYQNHVSVYHRGVPLWLFNSGSNPRRPSKQVKFTLAEKGTGFILWQDRIDACSDFKVYGQRKSDNKIVNYANYCDKFEVTRSPLVDSVRARKEQSLEHFSAMLVTFRASDKKTTVFVKFDMNIEAIKFHEHFASINKTLSQEVKQRTKSLPAGVNMNITNKAFNSGFISHEASSGVVKRVKNPYQNHHEVN